MKKRILSMLGMAMGIFNTDKSKIVDSELDINKNIRRSYNSPMYFPTRSQKIKSKRRKAQS